ncbi:MAG TPA: efflux RND transporter periplasmic adaptor subunit, partial [Acidimicrobiia bacterium]|nr:efflux RND transporter periplasmic adaptor subunit [Acidimicrobiia bacterium]
VRAMSHRAMFAFLVSALLLIACGDEEAARTVTAPPVMVVEVASRDIVDRIQATGQILAVEEASIAAEVNGRITKVWVREGAGVAAGDALLEIDREKRELELSNMRAGAAEAEEMIAKARRESKRIESLHARNAASNAQLDEAETAVRSSVSRFEAARAQLGLAERALRDASVTAPFAGLIARRHVSVGDYVSVGHPIFDLVALDPVEVEFHLTERDSGRAKIGDRVDVRVASHPDESFRATVEMVSPRIEPRSRTLRVKATLDNRDGRLRPGLFARVDLGVAERSGVPMIPEDAILQRSDGAVVFVLVGADRVERRNMRPGIYRDGWVEVVDGVVAGERVVVRGQSRLIDGSVVDLRDADGSAASVPTATAPAPTVAGAPDPARSVP